MADHPLPEVRADELESFRALQQLAYRCVETVGGMLYPGITERTAVRLLTEWAQDHGVRNWGHKPFAWFGERTAFAGFSGLTHLAGFNPAFFPSDRRLEPGMPVILDIAPVVDGFVADVGYTTCLGENPILAQIQDDLIAHRELIVTLVNARRTLADVAREVDALCRRQGVEPRHKAYPFHVLAHRIERIATGGKPRFVARFGVDFALNLVAKQMRAGRAQGWSPLWSAERRSEHAPTPGLWAVEPHLGFAGVGAKFEELLVVTADDAYWLDDDLPHVRRWRRRQTAAHAALEYAA
ncbi:MULTISPECIES: M24 family metallopeptidase [Burkholderia]|uniref:Xaa-Pro aminopeptidase n=1 Tax=Burkholderia savannae TaxID=1637837 RepID=A0ABR5T4N1_9BURK|nr:MULTISPECIES: M24 family metallopeptidase [Burkholderia]AOJ71497.1 Xaa-Pro aminopeptidase [Burkholderia savannae]AOJ83875.1 Xaa-Pro aminopeptidase [Burkholderia savannae]AOK49892.1 Xaa-Pro aminopeptidase [Burkholderia sp. MSMB617WGS]KGS04636.1 metallopeptidase M24 family protein [Burkholderia sp. ABCPW 111]KVG37111.1 Xaa-Pro aminopeptidase [Burkholderia sp. MSMB0265]